jgi:AGCS family alanine or glycine:cation symporter
VELIKSVIDAANSVIWEWPAGLPLMVAMLLGTGIFLTLRLGFINLRGFRHAVKVVKGDFDDPNDPGDISHFQALTTALSATVGIGNIAGVATAIHYGGPGALFWMWLTAFLGMTTKYTECTLSTHFRKDNPDGSVSGGPMYYIERGLGPKFKPLAVAFACCAVVSSFGSGNSIQSFTMADSFRSDFHLPTWLTGGVSAAIVAAVIIGGIKRIGLFASRVMPAMAILYFTSAVVVLAMRIADLPAAFATIVTSAFQPQAAVAGFAGATFIFTLRWGVKRGLFSNEAGQGSAPIAHAAARTDEPVREGAVALLEPFVDTLVICTLTGLMIVTTGVWKEKKLDSVPLTAQSAVTVVSERCTVGENAVLGPHCALSPPQPTPGLARPRLAVEDGRVKGARLILNHGFVDGARLLVKKKPANGTLVLGPGGRPQLQDASGRRVEKVVLQGHVLQNGSPLTAWALSVGLAPIFPWGSYIVTIAVFLFALSTAIGWSYYGDRSAQYLLGERVVLPYKLLFVSMHFVGAIVPLEVVWGFGDAALGLMSFPNLLAINALSGTVARLSRDYFSRDHVPFKKRRDGR